MASPKARKNPWLDSPGTGSQLRTSPRYLDPTASSTRKESSPKPLDRRSPNRHSPLFEKKHPDPIAVLESQISQVEHELGVLKDQLCSSEASKNVALKDAGESIRQLSAVSEEFEEIQDRILKHPDRVLATALDEIDQLKFELEIKQLRHSETELCKLEENLVGALSEVEDMKQQLKETESRQGEEFVDKTLMQLEMVKRTVAVLRADGNKASKAYSTIFSELEKSRAQVKFLEELVGNLKAELENRIEMERKRAEDSLLIELDSVRLEVEGLRSAVMRYDEDRACSVLETKKAIEMLETVKLASGRREAELEAELRKSKYETEQLKAALRDKETELQNTCKENHELAIRLVNATSRKRDHEKLTLEIESAKAALIDKEAELRAISEENEVMKSKVEEIRKARAAEKEAVTRISHMTEEVEKSDQKLGRVTEQLRAEQAAYTELEGELRKLKVQSDQWRKAAEAAACMLNNEGRLIERTGSMDSGYGPRTRRIGLPFADDLDEELLFKKRNGNMLSRFGVLWKRPATK